VAGKQMREPSQAVGAAAAAAGWSQRHRDVSGGWLRPTVFGTVDGLVTNASLLGSFAVPVGLEYSITAVTCDSS
jgi:vacuolar iron transporter family protein